jgi:hypothetical protein
MADSPTGPWGPSSDNFTPKFSDSPVAVRNGADWWIYFSGKAPGLYVTRDFVNFVDASRELKGDGVPASVAVTRK